MIKCTLCAATIETLGGRSPQQDGWTQVAIHGPRGNKYLMACPAHDGAALVAWTKTATAPRGK
jgi:hypothetical protein